MPPDISTTARPLIPTGRPPCPGWPPVNTNTSRWSTSTKISVSGCLSDTGSPCAAFTRAPISALSCSEVSGKRLSRRRARTANVPLPGLVSATAAAVGRLGRLVHPQRPADPDDPRHVGDPRRHPVHRRRVLGRGQRRPARRATRSTSTPSRTMSSAGTPGARAPPRGRWRAASARTAAGSALEEDLALLEQHARLADGRSGCSGGRDRIGHGHPSSLPAMRPCRRPRGAPAAHCPGSGGMQGGARRRSRPRTFRDKALILALSPQSRIP